MSSRACRTWIELLAIVALIAGCAQPKAPGGSSGGELAEDPSANAAVQPANRSAATPAATSNPSPGSAASQLRYGPQAGDEFGYWLTIEAKWKDYTETYQGPALYEVVSADAEKFELRFLGGLKAKIDAAPNVIASPPLPIDPTPPIGFGPRTITIGRRGDWIDSPALTPLPYVLGDLEMQVFEEFPEQPQSSWQMEHELTVQESSGMIHSRFNYGPQRGAVERLSYSRTDSQPGIVRIAKKYTLGSTTEEVSSAAVVKVTGNGQFAFNLGKGLIESLTMNYQYSSQETGKAETAAITVTYQLLSPDKLAAELKPRQAARRESDERSRQAYEDDRYPQFRGLKGDERILAKLRSSDEDTITETLGELAQQPTEHRSSEIAAAIAIHLKSPDVMTQRYAAQAMIHWGTRDVEADLVEATKSRESWTRKYAQDALEKIRGQTPLPASASPTYRTWSDASGAFQIEAQFLGLRDLTVRLQRKDGQEIAVPLEKLSDADRQYVQQQSTAAIPLDTTPVDLLAQIDPQRDQLYGTWTMEGNSLLSPRDQSATLVIPYQVPRQYTLTIVAERTAGKDSLNIGLIVGGRQTMLALEGWGVMASGLNTINGRTADQNETTFRTPVFTPGRPSTIVCVVRESSVQVSCNGQAVMNWTGDAQQLALDRRFWKKIPEDSLFLGTWLSNFRISKLELTTLAR